LKQKLNHILFEEGAAENALKPRRIVADCRKVMQPGDVLCLDNGIYKLWFARHYPTYEPESFLVDNALASMGAGLPMAITAKMVHPRKRVLAVCGDGGFMMNSQELETAVRLGLNIVILLLNDNGFGFIKWKQQTYGFEDFGLDYGNPDFVRYAQSYGVVGLKVNQPDDLIPSLEQAFNKKGPVLIECPIDYCENVTTWGETLESIEQHVS